MKENEIRIGNYFQFIGSSCDYEKGEIIRFHRRIWEELYQGIVKLEDIKPIPLTHDILLACGFIYKQRQVNMNGTPFCVRDTYHLQVFREGKDGTWFEGLQAENYYYENKKLLGVNVLCRGNYVFAGVDYLHELQNIYYDLKKSEMPINRSLLAVNNINNG